MNRMASVIVLGLQLYLFISHIQESRCSIMKLPRSIELEDLNPNGNGLTIMSLKYNENSKTSEWITYILGNLSIHHSSNNLHHWSTHQNLSIDEISNSTRLINEKINTSYISQLTPSCSFELQGHVRLGLQAPFTLPYRKIGPSIGNGILNIIKYGLNLKCYYRAVYEVWRPEEPKSKPNFWLILIYCPIVSNQLCNRLFSHVADNYNEKLDFEMLIQLSNQTSQWTNSFKAKLLQPLRQSNSLSNKMKVGVCLSIPYTSSDEEKYRVNGVMLRDWIKYYVGLGMILFIYDRGGENREFVFQDIPNVVIGSNVMYYDFTIRGLLDPEKTFKYDNNEMLGNYLRGNKERYTFLMRHSLQAVDKTQTYSHCRFEANVVYGIDNIIVIDYDEFLYFDSQSTTLSKQKEEIFLNLQNAKTNGVDQFVLQQRVPANNSVSIRDCVLEKTKHNDSLFDCYASFRLAVAMHSVKSIHIGLKCPLTNFHEACPSNPAVRSYDCICNSYHVRDLYDAFLHFSTNKDVFMNPRKRWNDLVDFESVKLKKNNIHELLYNSSNWNS